MVKVSRKNSKILYPLWILSQLKRTVSGQLCLDFCKHCFGAKLAEKPNFSDFKMISRFCSSLWVDSISTFQTSKIHENFSLDSFQSQEVNMQNPESRARRTQNFKVLCFEPNFRGRLYITSKGNPWTHFIKKPLTNLFIHDSSELYAFPQALSLTDTSSS